MLEAIISMGQMPCKQSTANLTLISENYLYLTPKMYERFDLLCRVYAGKPLDVFDLDEARSKWPPSFSWAETEGRAISIANKVPLQEIKNSDRLELRLGEDLPLDLFYEWLVWHEVRHVLKGDHIISFKLQIRDISEVKSKEVTRCLLMLMELQADEAAYNVFYPKTGLCRRAGDKELKTKLENLEQHSELLEQIRKKYLAKYEIKPCPVTPGKYLSGCQHKEGIPWAQEIAQFMN